MLQIEPLIEKFGEGTTRAYLQQRFKDPKHFFDFTGVYAEQFNDKTPNFHREIIEEIQKGGRVALGAPRGGAKSTLVGLEYLSWLALNGEYPFILYISDTYYQSKLHVGTLKAELENNEIINFIYPDIIGDKWGEEGIVVKGLKQDVFIYPLGAGMKVRGLRWRGKRPHLAILDDLENNDIVYSAERRGKLKRWFDFDLEPALDRYHKNIIFIGTILHYKSLLRQILYKKGKYKSWRTKIYKALDDKNRSFWGARFSVEYLKKIRDDPGHPDYVGSIVFAQEYQNEPQDDKDRIFKRAWIKSYNLKEELRSVEADEDKRLTTWLKDKYIYAGVDTAISDKESADFFSMYAMAFDKITAREYMLDVERGKYPDINEQVRIICDMVEDYRIDQLGIEAVAFQQGLYNLVRQELNRRGIYTCKVIPIKTDKDKKRRAKIHSSAFEGGFIYLREDSKNYSIILQELLEFPLGQHDDTLDSLMLARETRSRPRARVFEKKPF